MTTANQTTPNAANSNGAESCNTMDGQCNQKLQTAQAILTVKPFLSRLQMLTLVDACRGEEGDYFRQMFIDMAHRIESMPSSYEQDGMGEKAVVHLNYFLGGSDWYILEKDVDGGVQQAFGYAVLNGDEECAELGYISIAEITRYGAELNLYFQPCTLVEIKAKRQH